MSLFLKLLISLAIGVASAAAGGSVGVGVAFCFLRAEDSGPGAAVAVFLCGLIGLVIGLVFSTVGIIMFWRRIGVPVVSLPPAQGDTSGAVWPPPPSLRP